jgi:hypothetical protein
MGEKMKKIVLVLSIFVLLSMSLMSCVSPYDPAAQILPEHIKKLYVKPFINNTNQFGLEARFTNAVTDEVLMDGRLSLVNSEKEADGVLIVTVKRYILQPLTYDVNMVPEQYKLWIIASASLIDKDNNITLWTEPSLEGIQIYRDSTRGQSDVAMGDGMTEEEARDIVWQKMSKNIVKRVIKGFGSVTSLSEKKVPE